MPLDLVYPITLTAASDFAPDETGFVVSCPDLPEVHSQGEAEAEALANAADAIEEAIAGRIHHDEPIPRPPTLNATRKTSAACSTPATPPNSPGWRKRWVRRESACGSWWKMRA